MYNSYASEALVSTDWVSYRLNDPTVVIAEISRDLEAGYHQGHIIGAVGWDLKSDMEDRQKRDVPSISQLEELLSQSGIDNDTTIVLYSDSGNRAATWAFWVLKYYRHKDVRLMNGGRQKWMAEGRPTSIAVPAPTPRTYKVGIPNKTLRATRDYILANLNRQSVKLLDTRTEEEFTGEMKTAPGTPPSDIYRSGRIPGAVHIPWDDGATEDGSFKPVEELRSLYEAKGFSTETEVIPYCRLGVKSSYSWFVLKYILGFERVRNYDGSWAEWGNSVGVPIEVSASK